MAPRSSTRGSRDISPGDGPHPSRYSYSYPAFSRSASGRRWDPSRLVSWDRSPEMWPCSEVICSAWGGSSSKRGLGFAEGDGLYGCALQGVGDSDFRELFTEGGNLVLSVRRLVSGFRWRRVCVEKETYYLFTVVYSPCLFLFLPSIYRVRDA